MSVFELTGLQVPHQIVDNVMKQIDTDGSGNVSFDEFLEVMTRSKRRHDADEEIAEAFKVFLNDNQMIRAFEDSLVKADHAASTAAAVQHDHGADGGGGAAKAAPDAAQLSVADAATTAAAESTAALLSEFYISQPKLVAVLMPHLKTMGLGHASDILKASELANDLMDLAYKFRDVRTAPLGAGGSAGGVGSRSAGAERTISFTW